LNFRAGFGQRVPHPLPNSRRVAMLSPGRGDGVATRRPLSS
jgi:hypothetical protein